MRRRTRQLKDSAFESLTLSVEVFNRPSPVARAQGVMLPLQHAFEMLMKAAIWERRGTIEHKGVGRSFSLRECMGMLHGAGVLDESECVVIATIAATRDGVQHHGATVSEERLYVNAASGLRVFDDLLERVARERLADQGGFAQRMLPVTVNPPRELHLLTSDDIDHVRDLLRPSLHRHAEARALLRTLVVADRAAQTPLEELEQPTEAELERLSRRLKKATDWTRLLPGLARLSLEADEGHTYKLRVVKSSTAPGVRVVLPGEPGAESAVSLLKVDDTKTYCFYVKDLKEKLGLNQYNTCALIHLLGVRDDARCFKSFMMGRQRHDRYSHEALRRLRAALSENRLDDARAAYKEALRARRRAARAAA
jgi:uncharacterized protein YutE (UPF0331/DUF86 family)